MGRRTSSFAISSDVGYFQSLASQSCERYSYPNNLTAALASAAVNLNQALHPWVDAGANYLM
jgi:hypothetical protein